MNRVWVLTGILLVSVLFLIHFSVPSPLFADDAIRHYDFANFENCNSGYSNGICVMFGWFNPSEFVFWLIFFGISIAIPLLISYYFKEPKYFLLFFVFTGFFWNTMAMQVFAQIIMSLFLVFFLFHRKQRHRLIVLFVLLLSLFLGLKIHNTQFFFLVGVLIIEFCILLKDWAVKQINDYPDLYSMACGVLPTKVVTDVAAGTHTVREPVAKNIADYFTTAFYYFYSFFIENMFIGFVIPALYYLWDEQWYRPIAYLLLVLVSAFIAWFWMNWEIWWVTRIVIWIPLVLFVPFMKWLESQKHKTKVIFYLIGFGYFVFNFWYFLHRMQELGCGIAVRDFI